MHYVLNKNYKQKKSISTNLQNNDMPVIVQINLTFPSKRSSHLLLEINLKHIYIIIGHCHQLFS